ncbi:hypothetical protein BC834DRAFT_407492 [Gloeopeniophorella convolvens]|nr:hypothetical protein BC834DRAFT_407492 [Gloeopeniophorella convolvens]
MPSRATTSQEHGSQTRLRANGRGRSRGLGSAVRRYARGRQIARVSRPPAGMAPSSTQFSCCPIRHGVCGSARKRCAQTAGINTVATAQEGRTIRWLLRGIADAIPCRGSCNRSVGHGLAPSAPSSTRAALSYSALRIKCGSPRRHALKVA